MMQRGIRNFVIISHVDHGKSTLADRFIELTETVPKVKMRPQYLDMLDLERERGVTIKMAPVRMEWQNFVLNLIDTPGHTDFSYEVSRALSAVEGALLLVDGTQGVQAQTLYNLEQARKAKLKIIPVINKIDLAHVRIQDTSKEIQQIGFSQNEIIKISAKTGENVNHLLNAVIDNIPPPDGNLNSPFRALIFDSLYDSFKGVVAYVRIFDGSIAKGDKIKFLSNGTESEVLEVGYFTPRFAQCESLRAGEIGYLKTGVKDISEIKIGDTIVSLGFAQALPIEGFKEPKPMVYADIYPILGDDFKKLSVALSRLKLNDASLQFNQVSSKVLGTGFRCGFLGLFHLEIIKERIEKESGIEVVITQPTIDIKMLDKVYQEPYVRLKIVTPIQYMGKIMDFVKRCRAEYVGISYLSERAVLSYEIPLSEAIFDFYDALKNLSSGYASMSYEFIGYKKADLVHLDILAAGEKIEPLSQIVPREKAIPMGRQLVAKLKKLIPRHLFEISLQAAVEGKIVAREDIPALKKNVTAHLYGGDITRKKKLWEKQAEGKKKLKQVGRLQLPTDIFIKILRR